MMAKTATDKRVAFEAADEEVVEAGAGAGLGDSVVQLVPSTHFPSLSTPPILTASKVSSTVALIPVSAVSVETISLASSVKTLLPLGSIFYLDPVGIISLILAPSFPAKLL